MTIISQSGHCTGCAACSQICPKQAISMHLSDCGFWIPTVDNSLCIHCLLCEQVCPENTSVPVSVRDNTNQRFYAAWAKNTKIRKASSSGGVFSVIAMHFLRNQGVVFGVKFDRQFGAIMIKCENELELDQLRGSKYVQCNLGNTFREARDFLMAGKKVLFTGTPCQIAGLRLFLGKKYSNLVCLDIICHGVPSPGVYQRYLNEVEKKSRSLIYDMKFRNKKFGWDYWNTSILFENGTEIIHIQDQNPFLRGFLNNEYLNESCHFCRYTNLMRTGDLTLADFWGYIPRLRHPYYWLGVSQIIVNSSVGEEILKKCSNDLYLEEKLQAQASQIEHSLKKPFPPSPSRLLFFNAYKTGMPFVDLEQKFFQKKQKKITNFQIVLRRIKTLIPQNIKSKIKTLVAYK